MFTKKGKSPYEGIGFETRVSEIRSAGGEVIFRKEGVEVPSTWSQIATDILSQKYFRKSGVPTGDGATGGENSSTQVFHRLAYTWKDWGKRYGYFDSDEDADAFYDELVRMMAMQMASPNSPQLFNTGLYAVYGIKGPAQGHYYVDPRTNEIRKSESAFERPQPHACFILSVEDDLLAERGIYDLVTTEARLFKYGSGTGSNFSAIRGKSEGLSGGGVSSGLLSFLRIADRSASAIKSGGTTRRAAKMVILDADHPDVTDFIDWKVGEEHKVASLVTGSAVIKRHTDAIAGACGRFASKNPADSFDPRVNAELGLAIEDALADSVPAGYVYRLVGLLSQGERVTDAPEYTTDWEEEAYATVSGQSSNNSIRVTNGLMEAAEKGGDWELRYRTTGETKSKIKASALLERIAASAWMCADPALQFHTTINEWHTCLPDGEIRASNPCSEYLFLDDTACNLASINLMAFYDAAKARFKVEEFEHAVTLWTIVLEISVLMAQFPRKEVARKSYDYRTLGLGIANLGTLLMVMGIPYDSDAARGMAGAIAAVLTGRAYATSALMAERLGPFPRYAHNREQMLKVLANHRRAAYPAAGEYGGLSIPPRGLDPGHAPGYLIDAARKSWDEACSLGEKHGFRNAQVTAIAPTGTIGLLMDCDTTGIEPDFALVKYKKLAGGGVIKMINSSIPPALARLGYTKKEIEAIVRYCVGSGSIYSEKKFVDKLKARGYADATLANIDTQVRNVISVEQAFHPSIVGEELLGKLSGATRDRRNLTGSQVLELSGFSQEEIRAFSASVCGRGGIEGAPGLEQEHYAVFDTASVSGVTGTRSIHWKAHVGMMAAVQPFVSGAISKTINMPEQTTIAEVKEVFRVSWKSGLKAISIYRDGSKLSQPLTSVASGKGSLRNAIAHIMQSVKSETTGRKRGTPAPVNAKGDGRTSLPHRRNGYTQKAKIGGHSIFLRTGEYKDGRLGEIFLDMYKEGAAFRSLLNSFAIAVSLGLQYGVPLGEYVEAFTFTRFEPNGIVQDHDYIKMATSVIDFVFRDLALNYLKRTDLVQVKPDDLISTGTMEPGATDEETDDVFGESESDPAIARKKGYEGNPCTACGNFTLLRNGTCFKCDTCGGTTGCS